MMENPEHSLAFLLLPLLLLCGPTTQLVSGQEAADAHAKEKGGKTDQHVIVAIGSPGTEEYGEQFLEWAELWRSNTTHTHFTMIGTDSAGEKESDDKRALKEAIAKLATQPASSEYWLVLVGHGTFDGKRAKFNLRGKDVSATEIAEWLAPLKQRGVVINCTSSSAPFINALSHRNRVVVSSTRSGFEYNFSRFGRFMATAVSDLANDLDKDGQTSVLESFCAASRSVQDLYLADNRLATEHALIDDNGDKRGTPADWFEGTRTVKQAKDGLADGLAANQLCLVRQGADAKFTPEQRAMRFDLETKLEMIRQRKPKMEEAKYLASIEPILIELAQLYENADLDVVENTDANSTSAIQPTPNTVEEPSAGK